jgi:hypothetical protein
MSEYKDRFEQLVQRHLRSSSAKEPRETTHSQGEKPPARRAAPVNNSRPKPAAMNTRNNSRRAQSVNSLSAIVQEILRRKQSPLQAPIG